MTTKESSNPLILRYLLIFVAWVDMGMEGECCYYLNDLGDCDCKIVDKIEHKYSTLISVSELEVEMLFAGSQS